MKTFVADEQFELIIKSNIYICNFLQIIDNGSVQKHAQIVVIIQVVVIL
jgi:hypothetical protein